MIEKCQLASDEIAAAEVLNPSTVSGIVNQMESLKVSRMIVTDQLNTHQPMVWRGIRGIASVAGEASLARNICQRSCIKWLLS